jgi:hypothetical protein
MTLRDIVVFLKVHRDLAEEGLVVLGAVSDKGFVEWPEPIDESLAQSRLRGERLIGTSGGLHAG